jgi:hypothetical protein
MRLSKPLYCLLGLALLAPAFADNAVPATDPSFTRAISVAQQARLVRVADNSCTDFARQSCGSRRQMCKMVVMANASDQAAHDQGCESDFNACLVTAGCRY